MLAWQKVIQAELIIIYILLPRETAQIHLCTVPYLVNLAINNLTHNKKPTFDIEDSF